MIKDDLRGLPLGVYGRIMTNQAGGQVLQTLNCIAMAAPWCIAAKDCRFRTDPRRSHIAVQWIKPQVQVRRQGAMQ